MDIHYKLFIALERCACVAFILFLLVISFLCFCYGAAQLWIIEQVWLCASQDGSDHCLHTLPDGTEISSPTTKVAIDQSSFHPTTIGVVYCILFSMVGVSFIVLLITTLLSVCCPSSKYSPKQRNKRWKYQNWCCYVWISKMRALIPNRYELTYSGSVWLISLELKRCLFESLYLLQKGGINVLPTSANVGVSNRVETKPKVLAFAILLGSNCIVTSVLYMFWWRYFRFSALSFVILIVMIESFYDILFAFFPILSNNFQFGYMNFLDDVTNFLTTYFPLLYLLYSVKNSMKYIIPFINRARTRPSIANEENLLQTEMADHSAKNSVGSDPSYISYQRSRNGNKNDKDYNKKKYTFLLFIVFFLAVGIFIIVGTAVHLAKSTKLCKTDLVENWSSFYESSCHVKLYPFWREYPCDCRVFEVNTQTESQLQYSEETIQYGIRQFHHAQFIGFDSSIATDLHFTEDMYVSKALQVLNIDGVNAYMLDRFDQWLFLQILSVKAISSLENNGTTLGTLKSLQSINWSGSSSIKYLPDSFCNLNNLLYFNCNGCRLYALPSCFAEGLSSLITLELNYNVNLQVFPNTFFELNDTLNALYCYECTNLYASSQLPSYFVNFNISFMELILYGTPICNHIDSQFVEVRKLLNDSFACFPGCGDACFPYQVSQCFDECHTADCHYGLGFCTEPLCTDYSADYQSKMYDIHYHDTCYPEYNTSECGYGFGNCLNASFNSSPSDDDACYVEPPYLFNKTLQCGTVCQAEWINEQNWCDESCMNYSNGVDGSVCPYHYEQANSPCNRCTGYCDSFQSVWDVGFLRSSCDWISGCYLMRFAIPNVASITGNNHLKDVTANESLIEWWYNITNHSVSLMTPLNYQQTLYYLGPYLDITQFAPCWNLTHSRASQISCDKCFGDAWNMDVSEHTVDGLCNETTISDWACNG